MARAHRRLRRVVPCAGQLRRAQLAGCATASRGLCGGAGRRDGRRGRDWAEREAARERPAQQSNVFSACEGCKRGHAPYYRIDRTIYLSIYLLSTTGTSLSQIGRT